MTDKNELEVRGDDAAETETAEDRLKKAQAEVDAKAKTSKKTLSNKEADDLRAKYESLFIPSGITTPGYEHTRIRRWERQQVKSIRDGLRKQGVTKAEHLTGEDAVTLGPRFDARLLASCLVGKPKRGAQLQFRAGNKGIRRMLEEVDADQLKSAAITAILHSKVIR